MKWWILLVACCFLVSCASEVRESAGVDAGVASEKPVASALPETNQRVLEAIKKMPRGGGYRLSSSVVQNLQKSIEWQQVSFQLSPSLAKPSFCSSATYLVLLETMRKAEADGKLQLSAYSRRAFVQVGQDDGVGVWGRWNANGPGTARLFKQLKCGSNFTSYESARAGDFMKIWWTQEIGKYERGHLVIFLGEELRNGQAMVRFWSSNTPYGYGEKLVPKNSIKRVLFNRLENLDNLNRAARLPQKDRYLANMLRKRYSWSSVKWKCSVREQP